MQAWEVRREHLGIATGSSRHRPPPRLWPSPSADEVEAEFEVKVDGDEVEVEFKWSTSHGSTEE